MPYTYPRFNDLKEHLKLAEHDIEFIETIIDVPTQITRLAHGNIKVVGNTVYYKDVKTHDALTEKLIDLLDEGFDVTRWVLFMENIMLNPSVESRNSLFAFLERWNAPITEDGCFIAFKRVRPDYYDIYTGKTNLNKPGTVHTMDRELVNPNNNQTCSHGLHVAASPYLDSFANVNNSKTISVKVNPRDVCAVPSDYNRQKIRCCRYEVLDEVEIGKVKEIEQSPVYNTNNPEQPIVDEYYTPSTDYADDDYSRESEDYTDYANDYAKPVDGNPKNDDGALSFVRSFDGKKYTVGDILQGVKDAFGVTAWAKKENIPRSTAKGWIKKIVNNANVAIKNLVVNDDEVKPTQVVTAAVVAKPEEDEEWFIRSDGAAFGAKEILEGIVKCGGITAWAKLNGVPRSTAQGWVKKIKNKV